MMKIQKIQRKMCYETRFLIGYAA